MEDLVLDCVIPYIQDNDDLNSVSLVSRKFFDNVSLTRKHLTVHVHYLHDPSRLSRRFPNLESLTLESYSCGYGVHAANKCCIPVTPWIQEISDKFTRLTSLSILNMIVSPSDLKHLAKTRGVNLRSLKIWGCKMFSDDGLIDIARDCKDLRRLCLGYERLENDSMPIGEWLHELALCNTVMESLYYHDPFDRCVTKDAFDRCFMKDVTRLAKRCSNSLESLFIFPRSLSDFRKVFNHAKKLDHFGYGIIDEDWDYSGFKFPPNIRALRIMDLGKSSFPFLLPYLNQLRKLDLAYKNLEPDCQCILFERCPNLEILCTEDPCGDEGFKVIGQFCKKLRSLSHGGPVTQLGLIALAQGCPSLEYVGVNPLDISNEALEYVGTHLKNLRDFSMLLGMKDRMTDLPLDKGVRAMLMGCNKLEELDIHLCLGGLTDVGLGYIGKYGHNLRHLNLSYTGESDVGLLELLKGCPKLRELRLSECPFSEQAIATFVFNINQSLRYVWLNYGSDNELVLTRPMVSIEVLTHVYVTLAEKLHRLVVQLVADGSGAEYVKITHTSSRAIYDLDTPLVQNLVAKGILNEERLILDGSSEKALEITVQIAKVKSRFASAVSDFGDIKLQGRVKDGVPHLTKVGALEVDVRLDGHILLCRQVDETNTISSVTRILGEENVNISSMSVHRVAPRKQTVMVIAVDEKPSEEALKNIDEIPAVEEFIFLAL